jgi:hypothetical protein
MNKVPKLVRWVIISVLILMAGYLLINLTPSRHPRTPNALNARATLMSLAATAMHSVDTSPASATPELP